MISFNETQQQTHPKNGEMAHSYLFVELLMGKEENFKRDHSRDRSSFISLLFAEFVIFYLALHIRAEHQTSCKSEAMPMQREKGLFLVEIPKLDGRRLRMEERINCAFF